MINHKSPFFCTAMVAEGSHVARKAAYATKEQARAACNVNTRPYLCPGCALWHITKRVRGGGAHPKRRAKR